jgi:hypothetical protein
MRIIYSVWIGFVIIVIALFLFGCTRKVHTEKTQTSSSDTRVVNSDSIIAVNKTLSEAYEELLKTTNSTGVVFESIPCDTAKIAGSVPKPVNKITGGGSKVWKWIGWSILFGVIEASALVFLV